MPRRSAESSSVSSSRNSTLRRKQKTSRDSSATRLSTISWRPTGGSQPEIPRKLSFGSKRPSRYRKDQEEDANNSDDEEERNGNGSDSDSEESSPSESPSTPSEPDEEQQHPDEDSPPLTAEELPAKPERRDSLQSQSTTITTSSTRSSISLPAHGSPPPPSLSPTTTTALTNVLALQPTKTPGPSKRKRQPHRRRPETVKLQHAPLDLTTSTFDLLTLHAGPSAFKPGDQYTKFLIGQSQRSIRVPVPSIRSLGPPAPDAGKKSHGRGGLGVGKGTGGFAPKEWATKGGKGAAVPKGLREAAKKEAARMIIVEKWGRLEDLRVSIIACMASLKHYHHMLQVLKGQNKELEDVHKNIASIQHAKVSEILHKTETCTHEIIRLRAERTAQRARLKAEWKRFLRSRGRGVAEVELEALKAREGYEEVVNEYEELIQFERTSKSDPHHLSHVLAAERAKLVDLKESHTRALEIMEEKFEVEKREAEEEVEMKVMEFLELAESSLATTPLQQSHALNARLKHEINLHTQNHTALLETITALSRKRDELVKKKEVAAIPVEGVVVEFTEAAKGGD
ncbi:hypothetical protein HK097_002870, partial [Rhizophlyctis rosea]